MNEDHIEKFSDIAEHLKAELNLMDSVEHKIKKGIDEITLNDEDYGIISEIADNILEPFYEEFGFDEDIVRNYSLKYLEKEHPEAFKKFLNKLTEHEVAKEIGSMKRFPYKPKPTRENVSIETLLKEFSYGNKEEREDACRQLEERFSAQSHDCQILIMKALLTADNYTRGNCYLKLLSEWWDDAFIPDVEQHWQTYRDSVCLRIIAHRFPLDYVLAHRIEIEQADYQSLCLRLATEEDFFIDKSRLSRMEYGRIIANNHIHLDEVEADVFLFGYILTHLDSQLTQPQYYLQNDENVSYPIYDIYEYYGYYLSLLINYKPSLTFIPGVRYLIWVLNNTDNTKTIMKFLLWNKRLQLRIPSFISEEKDQATEIQKLKGNFKAYMDWSWNYLMELAIATFPIDQSLITDDFSLFAEDLGVFAPY